jgi:hypothetical protein
MINEGDNIPLLLISKLSINDEKFLKQSKYLGQFVEVFVKIPALLEAFLCAKEGTLTPLTHQYVFLNQLNRCKVVSAFKKVL